MHRFFSSVADFGGAIQHKMWTVMDSLIEAVAGSGPARKLRLHQFRKEAEQCGVAQKRRAQSTEATRPTSQHSPAPTQIIIAPYPPLHPTPVCEILAISKDQARVTSRYSAAALPHEVQQHHEPSVPYWKTKWEIQQDKIYALSCEAVKAREVAASRETSASSLSSRDCKHSRSDSGVALSITTDSSPRETCPKQQRSNSDPVSPGFGRFRHLSDADPKSIKAQIEQEFRGPGRANFWGPDALNLGEHPLVYYYNKRRESASSSGSEEVPSPLSPTLTMSFPSQRLAYKERTLSSTTVTPDGCIVQKGFEIRSKSASPSKNQQQSTRPDLLRSATWNGRRDSRVEDDDLEKAQCRRRVPRTDPHFNPYAGGVDPYAGIATPL